MTTLLGIELAGRDVLVVGGGPVAGRRAGSAAADGGLVRVVAPAICDPMSTLVNTGQVIWHQRGVVESDLDGVWLVHAATDCAEVNESVAAWASARRVWCVNAGAAHRGSARTPATTLGDDLLVGVVSTGSADPRRVKVVRDQLAVLLRSGRIDQRRHRWLRGYPAPAPEAIAS